MTYLMCKALSTINTLEETLEETDNRLQEELHILYEIKEVCEEQNLELLVYHTSRLLNCLSVKIKEMRTLEKYY